MDCDAARALLGLYRDGELADADVRLVDTHLAGCAECTVAQAGFERIGGALRDSGQRPASPEFIGSLQQSLRNEAATQSQLSSLTGWQQIAAAIALVAVTALATYGLTSRVDNAALRTHDLVTAHVRSLLQENLIQVASSDSHTVRPWFAGRLDFSPTVVDLKDQGYPLIGGRIDYVDGERVAVAIYKRNLHWINVFIRPAIAAAPSDVSIERGYNLISWTKDGFAYAAISDLSATELREFQRLL